MNSWKQAQAGMRYRMAHGYWFAKWASAAREGREFRDPEPRIEDFLNDDEGLYTLPPVVEGDERG
jgi:putative hemolysin